MSTRTGLGFDSHAFSTAGTLRLGGVSFPGVPALEGHSDGDALLHAIVDALLGAVSAGDIGQLFPDSDPANKGLSSLTMVDAALSRVREAGYSPVHLDAVVVADRPKLAPVREKMIHALSQALGLTAGAISVKGKTPEGLSLFSSPAGGIAVWATVNVERSR
jgi:2-C-methyl-D-erythritol 2,4-cyclodiphosphate synthase